MSRPTNLAIGLIALATTFACDAAERDGGAPPVLPNSVADTTPHTAQRAIPVYGAPDGVAGRYASARGQVLYVPVYSHVFQGSQNNTFDLTSTLSIRNTSPVASLTIHDVDYFDSEGTLLKSYVERPRRLGPLASTYVVISERERSGGVGANFIVSWRAGEPIAPPLVEAVMISTRSGQGISFTSPARVLQEW